MPITMPCPHCLRVLKAPDAALGKQLNCPGCNQSLTVQQPPASQDGEVEKPEPIEIRLLRSIRLAVWLIAGFLIAGLVVAFLWSVFTATQPPRGRW